MAEDVTHFDEGDELTLEQYKKTVAWGRAQGPCRLPSIQTEPSYSHWCRQADILNEEQRTAVNRFREIQGQPPDPNDLECYLAIAYLEREFEQ